MSGTRSRPLGIVVAVTEILALLATAAFVVMLFANEPSDPGGGADPEAAGADEGGGEEAGGEVDGAIVYADRCAACHGSAGEGGVGPTLAGGAVVEAFPDVADQILVVTGGRGGMPDFGTTLSAEEIEAVVLYTRGL